MKASRPCSNSDVSLASEQLMVKAPRYRNNERSPKAASQPRASISEDIATLVHGSLEAFMTPVVGSAGQGQPGMRCHGPHWEFLEVLPCPAEQF